MEARMARIHWETLQHRQQGNPPPSGQATDQVEALERLTRLRDTGAVTAEEFDRLKAELMNGA